MPHSQERDGNGHPELVQPGILLCTHTETALWRSAGDATAFCQQTIKRRTLAGSAHSADDGVCSYRVPCTSFPCTTSAAGPRHTFTPSVTQGKGLFQKKNNLQNGRFGCRLWGQDELAHSAAASRAGGASGSRRGGDRGCRYVEERASTKGCVVLSAGKGKGKAQESCKPGWERNFFGCHFVPHAYTEQ